MTETITLPDDTTIGVGDMTSRQAMICIAKSIPILANGERLVIERTSEGWNGITQRSKSNARDFVSFCGEHYTMTKDNNYTLLLSGVSLIINEARNASVRAINSIMSATYWEIGRMIVENEQKGKNRAGYGEKIIKGLSKDLTDCFGKGFSARNLRQMRQFYISKPIWQTPSAKLKESTKQQTLSAEFSFTDLGLCLLLPWSCYGRNSGTVVQHLFGSARWREDC